MERTDVVVVGAGVVGLAVAAAFAREGREVVVLEATDAIGTGTSSRNSEVIHAGLYYPNGSLKARLCVAGRRMLYRYCEERGVAAKALGKLVISATPEETERLGVLVGLAERNGVEGLEMVSGADAMAMEPEIVCHAAMVSPSTGVVDSHGLMVSLLGEVEDAGGAIAFNTPIEGAVVTPEGVRVRTGGESPFDLVCSVLVNAAGLHACETARRIQGRDASWVPRHYYAKGTYYEVEGRRPKFTRLIYPMPSQAHLGVHATIDLQGGVRFGPDVTWVDEVDYTATDDNLAVAEAEISSYWPGLQPGTLRPAYVGVRPKIVGPGEAAGDFLIKRTGDDGAAVVDLLGIESPGLTASLAIGERVRGMASA